MIRSHSSLAWLGSVGLALAIFLVVGQAARAENYAFLVAVQQYSRTELTSLRYTENDIERLAAALLQAGYPAENVVVLTQSRAIKDIRFLPTSDNIRQELRLLLGELTKADSLVVAFSGHGIQPTGEGSYFCPADAQLKDRTTLISLDEVFQQLKDCQAGQRVLLADACRDDPLSRVRRGDIELEPVGKRTAMTPPGGVAAFVSCAASESAFEDPDFEQGVFFHFVVEGLEGPADFDQDRQISLAELELYTVKKVQKHARRTFGEAQTPERRGETRGDVALAVLPKLRLPEIEVGAWVRIARASADLQGGEEVLAKLSRGEQFRVEDANAAHLLVDAAIRGHRQKGWVRRDALELAVPSDQATLTNSIGMQLAYIPPGEFQMGSTSQQVDTIVRQWPGTERSLMDDEQPRHRVRITQPFYLQTTEVTIDQFRRFVMAKSFQTEAERDGQGGTGWNESAGFEQSAKYTWRNAGFKQADDHPVVNVTWNDATAFCQWLSREEGATYRLPTEAEWEYACRAGTETLYAPGDDPERLALVGNVADGTAKAKLTRYDTAIYIKAHDSHVFTAPVAQFRPSAWGLYDLHGNVFEWCSDWYGAAYYAKPSTGDPAGPSWGSYRVFRGGGWNADPRLCRAANRDGVAPSIRADYLGFRVARSLSGQ